MQIYSVGIDPGKYFHLVALGAAGKVLLKKKFTQEQPLAYTANLQTSLLAWKPARELIFSGEPCASRGTMFG